MVKYALVNHIEMRQTLIFTFLKGNRNMNKADLIEAVARKTGLKKKDAEAAVSATIDTIEGALQQGVKVQLVGFGTFETKKRKAREGRNPKTGEAIKIKASKYPAFSAGKAFKEAVNK